MPDGYEGWYAQIYHEFVFHCVDLTRVVPAIPLGGTGLSILLSFWSRTIPPLGFQLKVIAVTRDTSSRILGTDIIAMRARCWGYGSAIWIANHDCFGELMRLGAAAYDAQAATPLAGSNALFVQSLTEDIPDRILGRPCFFSESAETLGTSGDLSLVNWSQYLEGLYQPLQSAESMHVRFVNHERAFKFWLRNAGAPWWRAALTPRESSTTLSPIVKLS